MTTPLSITFNIDPDINLELYEAVLALINTLTVAGHLEGIQVTTSPGYDETDFVTFEDLVTFLKSLDLKGATDKAQRIWWNLGTGSKFYQVNPHFLIVCNSCLLTTKECNCGSSYRSGFKVGVHSLMSSQRINYAGLSNVSRERFEDFIEYLRETRDAPATQ